MRNIGIKMSKTQFYRFTENNDNEGETWDFYFPMTEEEAKHFYGVFIQAETEVNDFPTRLSMTTFYLKRKLTFWLNIPVADIWLITTNASKPLNQFWN